MNSSYVMYHSLQVRLKNQFLPLLLLLISSMAFSQTSIKGRVLDEIDEPLIGAKVIIEGTTIGAATDNNGNYNFSLPSEITSDFVLVVSFTGYKTFTQSVSLGKSPVIEQNIKMIEASLQLEDIVVTANKKSESSQDVSASITALTPLALRRAGVTQFRDYASSIPNLSFGTKGGGGAFADGRTSNQIVIRGIMGANTVAMYVDETPLPANIDPRIIDVARVEVLRGPQGSLYGSSSMGGAVKTITNDPNVNEKTSFIGLSGASVNNGKFDYNVDGLINIPLSKTLAFRAVGFYEANTGVYDRVKNKDITLFNTNPLYTENAFGETTGFTSLKPISIKTDGCTTCQTQDRVENVDSKTNYGFHASLGFFPTSNISIIPKVIYQTQKGNGLDFADISPNNFTQIRSAGLPEFFNDTWGLYSVTAKAKLSAGELVFNSSYLNRNYNEQEDQTEFLGSAGALDLTKDKLGWGAAITRGATNKKFTNELRYLSQLKGKFNFVAGAFYADDKLSEKGSSITEGMLEFFGSQNPDNLTAGGIPEELWNIPFWNFTNNLATQEFSLFGEAYYNITSKLKATIGLRYFSANTKRQYDAIGVPTDFTAVKTDGSIEDSGLNPKFNLTYKINTKSLIYGTMSKGFRLGGVNDPIPEGFCGDELKAIGVETPGSYKSDVLWNYELGYKSTLADGRVTLNSAVFYNSWSNIQQFRRLLCGFGFISNAGSAKSIGFETDFKAKTSKNLEFGGGIGFLNSEIVEGGVGLSARKGDKILFTPSFTGNFNVQYTTFLSNNRSIYVRAEAQNSGSRYSTYEAQHSDYVEGFAGEKKARTLDGYTLVNMRAGMQFKKYEIALFAKNLTNETPNFGDVISLAAELPGRVRYSTARPRTIGVQARYYF